LAKEKYFSVDRKIAIGLLEEINATGFARTNRLQIVSNGFDFFVLGYLGDFIRERGRRRKKPQDDNPEIKC